MPSLPLPRFLETEQTRRDHARKLERAVRQSNGDLRSHKTAHTAADGKTLRGIPVVGRGVAGVIPGMRPDAITFCDEIGLAMSGPRGYHPESRASNGHDKADRPPHPPTR